MKIPLPPRIFAICATLLTGMAATIYLSHAWKSKDSGLRIAYDGASPTWDIGLIPQTTMHFEESVHYKHNSSASDDEWARLIPSNGGLVYIGNDREPLMLSMFHQLRCLDIMRSTYARRETPTSLTRHCLNYVRQMVLCRGDLMLEPVVDIGGPHTVQPWGPVTCTDWRRVYKAHEDNVRE